MSIFGIASAALNGVRNEITTRAENFESKGIQSDAESSTRSAQKSDQAQTAHAAQNQLQTAFGQVQANNQNQAAASAQLSATLQGNAQSDAMGVAVAVEQQREKNFSAILGAISK